MFKLNNIEKTTSSKTLIILNIVLLSVWILATYKYVKYKEELKDFTLHHSEIHNNLFQINKNVKEHYYAFNSTTNQIHWRKMVENLEIKQQMEKQISIIKNNVYEKVDFLGLLLSFLSVLLYFICPPFRFIINVLLTFGLTFWTLDKINKNN